MSGEIVKEWHFWLVSVATGAFLAFAYDVIRLFRRLIRHGRFAVDLEDILYWTACFGLSFTLLYYGNNGVIRFAAVLGAAVGMLVYAVTVGRFFVKVTFFMIDKTIGSLFRLIRKIIGKLRKLLRPVKCFAVKNCHKIKRFFIRLFQKIRLTYIGNRHKMKVHNHKKAKDGKGETTDGRKNSKRKAKRKDSGKTNRSAKAKDTGVSPR
ncbi:MAG: spore cortex biosynthesis protein YabQ [Lachnospiraceae bacterium]|nr:spore cortex biosynthesis protein YabQ [Lachnospiraceae bacterium]